MGLVKSHGNMYDWVTHMHSHLAGECPHKCAYCYVQRNPHGVSPRWKGEPRLIEKELGVKYDGRWFDKKDKTWKTEKIIFIEHMGDLFAEEIERLWIHAILDHCLNYKNNEYIFQTKNPQRISLWLSKLPEKLMVGTTIETNRTYRDTKAPKNQDRYSGMLHIKGNLNREVKTFITIEPIMDFDIEILVSWIIHIQPDFVNIGADSKHCNLPEPPPSKVKELISELKKNGIVIKKKSNLERLLR